MAFMCGKHQKRKDEVSKGFCCSHPNSFFSCLTRTKKSESLRDGINEKIKKLSERKSSRSFDDGERKMESAALAPHSAKSCDSCHSCSPHHVLSGNLEEGTLFNLGGHIDQFRESKELNKIKDLHKEMKDGFQSLKDKLITNGHDDIEGVGSFQEVQSLSCLEDPKIGSFMSSQRSTEKTNLQEDELEAELEHLQIHIDSETMLLQEEEYTEIVVENSAPEGSLYRTNHVEIVDPFPKVIHNEGQNGVSPYELEVRLHEVLEARQQERINELEEALHCATQKIEEKERELSIWKDTAKLFLQHVPAVPNERRALAHHPVEIATE